MTNSDSEAHVTHRSDSGLVRHTLQGDTTAFGTLVERYKQVLDWVCVSLLGDFALAQNLAQDVFLKAFQPAWAVRRRGQNHEPITPC